MDKQQFDHIENRIRQAAEGITTPVTEEAWQKMELLLDQEGKKDRKVIFWWWYLLGFFLLLGSGILYYYSKEHRQVNLQHTAILPGKHGGRSVPKTPASGLPNQDAVDGSLGKRNRPVTNGSKEDVPNETSPKNKVKTQKELSGLQANNDLPLTRSEISPISPRFKQTRNLQESFKKTDISYRNNRSRGQRSKPERNNNLNRVGKEQPDQETNVTKRSGQTDPALRKNMGVQEALSDTNAAIAGDTLNHDSNQKATVAASLKKEPGSKDSSVQAEAQKKNRKPSKTENTPGFYLIASVAADATSVDKFTLKDYNAVFGLGVGYRVNKRISVQTGFYAGQKIYTAGPEDYKIRQGSNISSILFINADCYIYEVPVMLRYDVIAKRKYNVYAAAGLSTYIFKKENYDFHFFNLSGAYRRMPYNYKNNTDLFSVADLSLGFEHKLFKTISIQGEPYIKFPLSGLGEGKVKLNSAGFLVGIKYQPRFKKSKK